MLFFSQCLLAISIRTTFTTKRWRLMGWPGNEALVDAVVLSLQVEDLQSLLACCHPGTCLNNNNHDNMMMLDEGDNGITTEPEEASRLFSRECSLCLAPLSDTATQLTLNHDNDKAHWNTKATNVLVFQDLLERVFVEKNAMSVIIFVKYSHTHTHMWHLYLYFSNETDVTYENLPAWELF